MNPQELAIIALCLTIIAFQFVQLRFIARMIHHSAITLDNSLAEALKTTIENLPDALKEQLMPDLEPPNPIQTIIAQMLQSNMNPSISAKVIPSRNQEGRFETDTSS